MASHTHLDVDEDFGGEFAGNNSKLSGNKRGFADLDDDEDDIFGSKKGKLKEEEIAAPGVATGMILSLRESLQECEDRLATCQRDLDAAKSEIQKWHSAFQNEPFVPSGTSPEPRLVVSYVQNLKSSEEFLREQLEKSRKKEAAFIVTFAKREQEIAELKSAVRDLRAQQKPPSMQARRLLLDPAIHEEFTRLKNLVEEKDKKVKQLQEQLDEVQFTPQSRMGKQLMAKCRTLLEENELIGNQANEGKIHELGMKLALQKSQYSELKSHFEGLCQKMEGLTDDVDRSNEMVAVLQEKLEERDAEITRLKHELEQRNGIEKERSDVVVDENPSDEGTTVIAETT
ncbi:OLC1v1000530C2 [Oldenlandia corymbosa var. corymbosa]|uniref:OLC1v1000530C2 n=1 Tax=Oldenlandia corymbosa var. corymbosa TaxID=529605 RepID=A0AAV1D411_OLDCO|nr:OLC1v1000530C2 [Oldenlandia corymbosa var. corymbosa]